jgi:DNA-binding Lrp family transcriptional regulator
MLVPNILSILITAVIFLLCYIHRHRVFRDFEVFIRRVALLVFLSGFVIYFIGFRSGDETLGTQLSWYASFLRPLLSSMEMFAFHCSLVEVGEPCHHNMVYMTFFSVIHFAAAAVSFAVAINYLGVRFRSAWRWRKLNMAKKLKGDVHIFFGINEVSLGLAHDIHNEKQDDTIIFINAPEDTSNQGMLGFASIFNVFSFRREIMAEIDHMQGIIRQTRVPIQLQKGNDVIHRLGLDRILNKTHEFAGFYLLYDDELQNLAKNIKLRGDEYFKENTAKKAYIFCRATSGKLNGGTAFEYNSKYGVETILVDAAQLAVKTMMAKKETHPANYIDFDHNTGKAKTVFHCMIIGFGETGQEAFKFLYEHGQFIYPAGFEGKHAVFHILDPKAGEKKGFFEMRYPCLCNANNLSPLNVEIKWHSHSAGDSRFWELMNEIKDDLNYIVIATGSDNRNIAIAYDLGEYALRWRKRRLEKFGIVTRCYNTINEARYQEMSALCIDDEHPQQIVQVIGKMSESFTHQYVWKNHLERDAAVYAATFANNSGKDFADIQPAQPEEAFRYWWKRHASVKSNPVEYANLKRIETQEFSDAFHIFSKLKAIGVLDREHDLEGKKNLEKLMACKNLEDLEELPFFETLLKMEHFRCIASHECLGYTPMSREEFESNGCKAECDVIRHKSLNLVAWNKLSQLPSPQWLLQMIPKEYKNCPNRYILASMVETMLAIGLSKLKK